eukprot:symbB.v1.2.021917.t1/scaffold1924.1/size95933/4
MLRRLVVAQVCPWCDAQGIQRHVAESWKRRCACNESCECCSASIGGLLRDHEVSMELCHIGHRAPHGEWLSETDGSWDRSLGYGALLVRARRWVHRSGEAFFG